MNDKKKYIFDSQEKKCVKCKRIIIGYDDICASCQEIIEEI